jgi:hypothetical protein
MSNKKRVRVVFPFAVARFDPCTGDWSIHRAGHSYRRISVLNPSEEAAWADAWKNIRDTLSTWLR